MTLSPYLYYTLPAMKQNKSLETQAIQRTYLHDAAQTLEIDADDESIEGNNFGLVFDSHRNAIAVARLAVKNYKEKQEQPNLAALPCVMVNGNKYIASINLE